MLNTANNQYNLSFLKFPDRKTDIAFSFGILNLSHVFERVERTSPLSFARNENGVWMPHGILPRVSYFQVLKYQLSQM